MTKFKMNRRTLLKTSFAASVVSQLPSPNLLAQGQKFASITSSSKSNGFKRFSLGDLELTIVTDGYIRQSLMFPFLAPLAQPEQVRALLKAAFRPIDSVEFALNIMVVKSKDRLILLDTGLGIFAGSTQGRLAESLAEAGFRASDFTDVILSHGHTDHIGGLVDKQDNLIFSNATIYISKPEYDFWQKATIKDFEKSPLYKMQDFVKQTITGVQHILKLITPKLKFIDTQRGLHDIFSFQLAPGHTPGLTMTTLTSKDEKLIFIADLIHSDALLFAHPEWGFFGDTNLQQAVSSRIKILKQLSTSKIKTFTYHLPWPGLGHVRQKGNSFEWVPEVYSVP